MDIVIVEGDERSRTVLQSTISSYDPTLSCHTCSDPYALLKMAAGETIDLAFLDIQHPVMSGLELARRLKSIHPDIKLVFTTDSNQYAAEAFELEIQDYLLKPVQRERLLRTLDKLLLFRPERRYSLIVQPTLTLRIEMFGRFVIYHGQKTLKWKRRKAAELFAYLLTYLGMPVSKFQICENLWPNKSTDKALTYLQTLICHLRKNISEISRDQIMIEYADNDYRMLMGPCYVDVHAFEDAYSRVFASPPPPGAAPDAVQRRTLLEAYNLYKDHYLVQEGWLWAMPKQQSLEARFQRILMRLLDESLSTGTKTLTQQYLARLADLLGEAELDLDDYQTLQEERQ